MATRESLMGWVIDALQSRGGSARIADISRHIWEHHEQELRKSGDLFYVWQYDMRWAGQRLQKERRMRKGKDADHGIWFLTPRS